MRGIILQTTLDCQAQTRRDFIPRFLFNEERAVAQRAIIKAVGIAEQFEPALFLIDNHRAGFHSERMEARALPTNFKLRWILRCDEITYRPGCAVKMEMPNNAANRFSILRHGCTGPMRCDVFIL
jgi:hypothetical protein